jgi:DNA-directed RNA polymerase subunit RPC12/RpoP
MSSRQEREKPARLPNELRGEERSLEALRARQLADDPGHETVGRVGPPADGVLTQVCLECGKEYLFDKAQPPADLVCEKCGNSVFRSFFTVRGYDEVEADFQRSTERDLAPNDTEADVTLGDIMDLNNL